ncbi:MAG: Mrp/NBP35 family ATP-binding protein [Myxococcales bacterium]|nr:Mrp/NBP35 family ATP-binding protein [Myxococcales bacterium]
MALDKQVVLDALSTVKHADLDRDVVSLDLVKELKIKRKLVHLSLRSPTPLFDEVKLLAGRCREVISALDGAPTDIEVEIEADVLGAPAANRRVLKDVRNIIAVASGKGGVAKSTSAVNIALSLRQAGARVGILDADIYGPSLPTMLTVDEEPTMGAKQRINPAVANGLFLISMGFFVPAGRAAILRGPMVSGYVSQFLANVNWPELDYLVIDYPPGTGDIQLTLSQQAPITGAVVCTTPQDVALIDVEKAVAMFDTTKIPVLGVIETMSYFTCDHGTRYHIFGEGGGAHIADRSGVPFLGEVPIDPRVARGGDDGEPIVEAHPEAEAAVAYRNISRSVAAQLALLNIERGNYLESFSLKWDAS